MACMIAPTVPTTGKKNQAAKFKPTVGHEAPSRYRAKKGKKSASTMRPNVTNLRGLGTLTAS
jgi:hypothetical protein